ncbi:MAG TPA: hypothetical protein VKF84_02090 [Candidatus Sulfotelmatobacter sp.]|nr:hypothetical protein [Candidatus Sulfotelmatobacter sp.]
MADYTNDVATYKSAMTPGPNANADLAKQARNNIAYGLMAQIDVVYGEYYNQLFTAKGTAAVGGDFLTLGLSSAASIATHGATKTIFSALGTGFSGLSLSIDKNFFSQQAFPVIGVAMQTRRDKVRATIVSNLSLDTTAYPLLAARRDLIAYLNAGTLANGLQELQEEAGSATNATAAAAHSPAAPTGLAAVGNNAQVSLQWAASAGATSYNLYYSTTGGVTPDNGTKISGITTTSYTHSVLSDGTPLKNGTPYYYVATAVNENGESAASNQASATPVAPVPALASGVPSAPVGLAAVAGNAQVSLLWTAAVGATMYNLYYSTTAGVALSSRSKIPGITTTSYTHSTLASGSALKNGATYYYVATAVNAKGEESAASNELSAVPLAPKAAERVLKLTPH